MVDIFLGILIIFCLLRGVFRGFLHQVLSLAFLVLGYVLSKHYAVKFISITPDDAWYSTYLALSTVIVFFAVVLVGAMINQATSYAVSKTPFGPIDRIAGGGLGFSRGIVFAMLFVYVAQVTGFSGTPYWQSLRLAPKVENLVHYVAILF